MSNASELGRMTGAATFMKYAAQPAQYSPRYGLTSRDRWEQMERRPNSPGARYDHKRARLPSGEPPPRMRGALGQMIPFVASHTRQRNRAYTKSPASYLDLDHRLNKQEQIDKLPHTKKPTKEDYQERRQQNQAKLKAQESQRPDLPDHLR